MTTSSYLAIGVPGVPNLEKRSAATRPDDKNLSWPKKANRDGDHPQPRGGSRVTLASVFGLTRFEGGEVDCEGQQPFGLKIARPPYPSVNDVS
jgi:hypothetical protein